jgi:hypothetical protein
MRNIILKENIINRLIFEATASEIHEKYYSNIPDNIFNDIINSDIISSNLNANKLGEYAKWLLNLYKKGNLKTEDLYKAKEYIPIFDKMKKAKKLVQPDINIYNSLSDMYKVIEPYMNQQTISNKENAKNIKNTEADLVYEDNDWKVITPKTYKASCLYGANTQWCTASKKSDMQFNKYSSKGKLYININKKTGRKYQFHFETDSFMDETDDPISLRNIGLTKGLIDFYTNLYPNYAYYFDYDFITHFFDGYAKVKLNNMWNIIDTKGRLVSKQWFNDITFFMDNGLAKVKLNNKYNYINEQGNLLSKEWFAEADFFHGGYASVKLNRMFNFINKKNNNYFIDAKGNLYDINKNLIKKNNNNENKNIRNIIINESQENKLIILESINQIVLDIKNKILDPHYKKGIEDFIDADGKLSKKKVIGVSRKTPDGKEEILDNITPMDLFYIIEDNIKDLIGKSDKRDEFIKQIIIDWFNNSITKEGSLSKNLTL